MLNWPTTCSDCELHSPQTGTVLNMLLCECGKSIALCSTCESQRTPGKRHKAWRKIDHEATCRTHKDLLNEDQVEASKEETA